MCVYVMESLPVLKFSNSYLSECFTLEVTISNRRGFIITLYRSPSQTSDEFDYFISNLETLFVNITSFDPHFVILLGDFNVKSKSWSVNDTITEEGTILENLVSLYGMKELISATTRDTLWMNDRIKHLIKKEKTIFQKQKQSKTVDHTILSDITLELKDL